MFAEYLQRVMHETKGAVAVTLMGYDGIAIDSLDNGDEAALDAQAAVLELGNLAKQLKTISESLGTGDIEEFMVQTGTLTTVLRPLTEEYFLALSLGPDASSGKGRYLLRVIGPKVREELA